MATQREVKLNKTFAQYFIQAYPEHAEDETVREWTLAELRRVNILIDRQICSAYLPANCANCGKLLIGWWELTSRYERPCGEYHDYVYGQCVECGRQEAKYLSTHEMPGPRLQPPTHYWNPYFVAAAMNDGRRRWDKNPSRKIEELDSLATWPRLVRPWTPPLNHPLAPTLSQLSTLQPLNEDQMRKVQVWYQRSVFDERTYRQEAQGWRWELDPVTGAFIPGWTYHAEEEHEPAQEEHAREE